MPWPVSATLTLAVNHLALASGVSAMQWNGSGPKSLHPKLRLVGLSSPAGSGDCAPGLSAGSAYAAFSRRDFFLCYTVP